MMIYEITDDKKQYLTLLLLADEQEDMIDRYLERGTMYVLDDDGIKAGSDVAAKVTGEVVKQGKNKKIVVLKYKAKKGYRRKNGHRQPYTRVRITGIA